MMNTEARELLKIAKEMVGTPRVNWRALERRAAQLSDDMLEIAQRILEEPLAVEELKDLVRTEGNRVLEAYAEVADSFFYVFARSRRQGYPWNASPGFILGIIESKLAKPIETKKALKDLVGEIRFLKKSTKWISKQMG